MFITKHAVKQFIARIDQSLSLDRATSLLIAKSETAEPTGDRTETGQAIWRIRDPDALLITKHDPGVGAVCVTVLAPEMPEEREETKIEVMKAAKRLGLYEEEKTVGSTCPKELSKKALRTIERAAEQKRLDAEKARKKSLIQASEIAGNVARLWVRRESPEPYLKDLRDHPLATDPHVAAVLSMCSDSEGRS